MKLHPARYRWECAGWVDLLFAGIWTTGAVALALWQTLLVSGLVFRRLPFADTYTQISDKIHTVPAAWAIFLAPSLALGISACCLAIVWLRAAHPKISRRDRNRAWFLGLFSLVVCGFFVLVQLRFLALNVMAFGVGIPLKIPSGLGKFLDYPIPSPDYSWQLLTGALILLYSILQSFATLSRIAARPRSLLAGLAAVLTLAGGSVWISLQPGDWKWRWGSVLLETQLSEEEWSFLTNDEFSSDILDRYWKAFGPAETLLNDSQMRRASWSEECLDCVLPRVPFLTLRGLPVLLDERPPLEVEPSLVVEVFSACLQFRAYPLDKPSATPPRPLEDLSKEIGTTQWLLLKVHARVKAQDFEKLISILRGLGVRKLTLAAIPVGFQRPPTSPALLRTDACIECKIYSSYPNPARPRPRRVMVVRKYIPPPGLEEDRSWQCRAVDKWELRSIATDGPVYLPEALPPAVQLPHLRGQWTVQELVADFAQAWHGGARTIHLAQPETAPRWRDWPEERVPELPPPGHYERTNP